MLVCEPAKYPCNEFDCATTVQQSNVFILFGLLLSEKQIPRFVGDVEVINGVVGVELCAPKAGALLP